MRKIRCNAFNKICLSQFRSELGRYLNQNWGTFKWIWKLIKATLKQSQSKLDADLKQISGYESRKRIFYSDKFHLISFRLM